MWLSHALPFVDIVNGVVHLVDIVESLGLVINLPFILYTQLKDLLDQY